MITINMMRYGYDTEVSLNIKCQRGAHKGLPCKNQAWWLMVFAFSNMKIWYQWVDGWWECSPVSSIHTCQSVGVTKWTQLTSALTPWRTRLCSNTPISTVNLPYVVNGPAFNSDKQVLMCFNSVNFTVFYIQCIVTWLGGIVWGRPLTMVHIK